MIEEQEAVAIIPDRSNAKAAHAFSQIPYRLRNRGERFFCLAMIKLATIRI